LTIAVPSFVAAEGLISNQDNTSNVQTPVVVQQGSGQTALGDCTGEGPRGGKGFGSGGQMGKGQGMMGKGQGMMGMKRGQGGNFDERKTMLLSLVEKYSPDTKDDWQAVIEKRDELKDQWLSPENEEARQTYMEERQAEMQILRDQLVKGEITREEMRERMMNQKGNAENRGVYLDLQAAVDAGDKEQIGALLKQMLEEFLERNAELENRLKDVKK
ncbi:MAG TPA: hypothetical protein DCR24_06730, partial [Bacillus bacterium]|nr:hypothetical protein [Bacillus sp. (in: firmicutes)]